jgi:hypothetical protein
MSELRDAEKAAVAALSRAKEQLDLIREAIAVGSSSPAPKKKAKRSRKEKAVGSVPTLAANVNEPSRVEQGPAKTKGRKPKFTDDEARFMAGQVAGGSTLTDVAKANHVSIPTVQRYIAKVNGAQA